jgi:hypothetical protein
MLWVKPLQNRGLQFQRSFFIVPAALRFVNEGGHELLLEIRSGRGTAAKWLVAGVLCKPLETGSLSANRSDFCLVPMNGGAREGKHRFTL